MRTFPPTRAGRIGGLLLLCVVLFAVCGQMVSCAPEGNVAEDGPALTIGIGRELYYGPDDVAMLHGSTHTWEALTYLDKNLRPRPWLARSWHSEDCGRVWIFELRQGVLFHDGSPFTAQDAAFCIRRIKGNPKYDSVGSYRDLIKVEAVGPLELRFTLGHPCPAFPGLVAQYNSPMIKSGTVDKHGHITRLVATGPFRFKKVVPGYELLLEAFPKYWGVKPAYRRVNFRLLPDAQTRAMALIAGEIDALADIGAILPEQAEELGRAPGISLKSREVATTHYLVFNCRRIPFSGPTARRWLLGQMGRQQLVRRMAGRVAISAHNTYSRLARDYDFGLLRWPRPEGTPPPPPGRPLVILLHNATVQRWPYLDLAQAIHQLLAGAGLPAEIRLVESGLYYQAYQKGEFDLAMTPNTLMTGEPDFFYSYYLAGDAPRNPGWRDPAADRLIAAARREMNPAKRRELIRGVERIVNREAPLWPMFYELALYAQGPGVTDFSMDYFFRPDLLNARPAARD